MLDVFLRVVTIGLIVLWSFNASGEVSEFAPPNISSASLSPDNVYIAITFSEGIWGNNTASFPVNSNDLAINFVANGGTATGVAITDVLSQSAGALGGGENTIRVLLSVSGRVSGQETIEIGPADGNSIFSSAGEPMDISESTGPINLNPQPAVISINANPSTLGDGDDGGTFSITLNFDQDMDTGINPTILFPIEDPNATLSFSNSGWNSPTQYRSDYLVNDGNQNIADIDVEVSIAENLSGLAMFKQDLPDIFSIQMCTPQVSLSSNVNTACIPSLANGEITVDVALGTGDYTVQLSGPSNPANQSAPSSQFTFSGLESGQYTVTVTDNGTSCQNQAMVNVSSASVVPLFSTSITDNSNCVLPNGEVLIDLGGAPASNYRFELFLTDLLPINSLGSSIGVTDYAGLSSGRYYIEVTDISTGCSAVQAADIDDISPTLSISSDLIESNISCSASTGSISITVTGGLGTITTAWTGPSGFTSTNEDITSLSAGDYSVTATDILSGCTTSSMFTVSDDIRFPVINSFDSESNAVCVGNSTNLIVDINSGTGPFTLTIDQGVGSISNYNSGDAIAISPTANTTYTITSLVDSYGCSPSSLPGGVTVLYDEGPTIYDLSEGGIICDGSGDKVELTLSNSDFNIDYNLLLDGDLVATNSGIGRALIFFVDKPGTYTVVAVSKNDCAVEMNGQANVRLASETVLTGNISGDASVCVGEEGYVYTIDPQPGLEIKWSTPAGFTIIDGAGSNQVTVRIEDNGSSGEILVSGVSDCGETEALRFPVTVNKPPSLGIEVESPIFSNEEITFKAIPSEVLSNYSWDFGDGNMGTGESSLHTFLSSGNFRVSVTAESETGCLASASQTIRVSEKAKVIIKNVITPNGDGQNDVLWIENIEDYPRNKITFLDRWGVEVATFSGYQNDWDLTNEGEYIPGGNYLCIVSLEGGFVYSMTITVIR